MSRRRGQLMALAMHVKFGLSQGRTSSIYGHVDYFNGLTSILDDYAVEYNTHVYSESSEYNSLVIQDQEGNVLLSVLETIDKGSFLIAPKDL